MALTKPEKGTHDRHNKYRKQLSDNVYASIIKIVDIDDNLYDVDKCMSGESLSGYIEKQEELKQFLIELIDKNIRKTVKI